ncbi:MAG: alpha/beta fold hydrolase [Phormidesmis sp.]
MPIIKFADIKLNYLLLEPVGSPALLEPVGSPATAAHLAAQQPTVVMVHGLATNFAFWHRLATALAETHRVLLFDLRGHGRSSMPPTGYTAAQMASDLHRLLTALSIDDIDLIGHSFGGAVTLQYALQWPNQVNRLVIADSRLKALQPQQQPSDWPHWERLQKVLHHLEIDLDADEPEAGYRLLTALARVQVHRPELIKTAPKWMHTLYPQSAGKKTARRWLKLIETTQAWSQLTTDSSLSKAHLSQIKHPLLAAYGQNSSTLITAQQLLSLWPHMALHLIPDAGHFFPMSQPQSFLPLLQSFLTSPQTSRIFPRLAS